MQKENKTAREFLNNAKRLAKYTDWTQETIDNNTHWIEKVMQEYADQEKKKAFKEALDLAAENVNLIVVQHDNKKPSISIEKEYTNYNDVVVQPNKQSILSLKIK